MVRLWLLSILSGGKISLFIPCTVTFRGVLVSVGQQVKAGQPIALVGGLGVAIGPHLHLEVRLGGSTYYDTRNPDLWVRPDPGYGVIAGRVVDYQNYFVPQQLVTLHRVQRAPAFLAANLYLP